MTTAQQQQAAKNFAAYWKDKGYEKGESQPFWLSLLRDVYGVEHPEQFIQFEEQVHLDHTSLYYVTPYELRHSFASYNKKFETWVLDEVMGHAHEGMSLGVYAHACEGDMDGVTDRIDGNLLKQIDRGQKHIQKSIKKC